MDIFEIRRQNLRLLVKEKFNGKIAALAGAVDRAASYLSRCLTDNPSHRKGIGERVARDIESKLLLPVNWLDIDRNSTSGQLYELGESLDSEEELSLQTMEAWDENTPVSADEVAVPFLREVELAAGSGRFSIEENADATLRFSKRDLRKNGVQFDQARCVKVRGNSMLPILRDGATVGVDIGKSSIGDVVDGDLYAISHNGQLRVKQVYRLPTGIRLRSFNRDEHPDEDYTFAELGNEEMRVLGHVFWWAMYAR